MTTYTTTTTSEQWMVTYICPRCNGSHPIEQCPQVKAIEYDEQHRIKRIEFLTPGDYMPGGDVGPAFKPPYDITLASTDVTQDTGDYHKTWTST